MIDRGTIEKIKDAAQIVDVVQDFVSLRRTGANYKGLCPFHQDNTPSMIVSPAKGLFKCFACGKGGDSVRFVMEHEQMTYPDALRYLANKYHIPVEERELTSEEKLLQSERESMFVVNDFASKYFQNILQNDVDGRAIGMAYFRSRGFRDDTIKKFLLGYSPADKYALAKEAKKQGYEDKYLLATGLCYETDKHAVHDRFWGRAMFPVRTVSGRVVAFGGRVLDAATKGVERKYVNSPESSIYSKRREVYGLYEAKSAIVKQNRVFVVEGYTDVISMHQAGVENIVASSGTAFTPEQIKLLKRFTSNITLLFDGDAAGIGAAEKATKPLLREGMNIKVLLLPNGADPDDFARKHSLQEILEYITQNEVDFITFKIRQHLKNHGDDPISKANFIKEVVEAISEVPDEITRSVYIRQTSDLLRERESILLNSVIKKRREIVEADKKRKEQGVENTAPAPLPNNEANTPQEGIPLPTDEIGIGMETPPDFPPYTSIPGKESPKSTTSPKTRVFELETLIMRELIRHGEQTATEMQEDENGPTISISVIDYISISMKQDELKFNTELYNEVLSEAVKQQHAVDGFKSEEFFLRHHDFRFSQLAAEVLTDRYQLSKMYSKDGGKKQKANDNEIGNRLEHLMNDLKLQVLEEEIKALDMQLPALRNDFEKAIEVMKKRQQLKEIQRMLAKQLGDRVRS